MKRATALIDYAAPALRAHIVWQRDPGACAPGFMLPPASRADPPHLTVEYTGQVAHTAPSGTESSYSQTFAPEEQMAG